MKATRILLSWFIGSQVFAKGMIGKLISAKIEPETEGLSVLIKTETGDIFNCNCEEINLLPRNLNDIKDSEAFEIARGLSVFDMHAELGLSKFKDRAIVYPLHEPKGADNCGQKVTILYNGEIYTTVNNKIAPIGFVQNLAAILFLIESKIDIFNLIP